MNELTLPAVPPELNDGQASAYLNLTKFISSPDTGSMFLLEGYAGTGKTYLVKQLLKWILQYRYYYKIAVTAPTNKAVKVLRKSAVADKYKNVEFATIHKLLGLKEHITDDGKQVFKNDSINDIAIEQYDVVIIDEVSMLADDLFLEVVKYNRAIKIIFMGDPAQIPPVNKIDCIPFLPEGQQKYKISVSLLTEIMRQKNDNPIIESSFKIRQNLDSELSTAGNETDLNQESKGVELIKTTTESDRESFIHILSTYFNSPQFKEDADHAKVIAWRNNTISKMNTIIRGMMFGADCDKIMKSEKLIANSPIVEETRIMKTILFSTNDEFEVINYHIRTDEKGFRYYDTEVVYLTIEGVKVFCSIKILHEDSEQAFALQLEQKIQYALKEPHPGVRNGLWREYYSFQRRFADVGYNYAITAHKAQGSTYANVFLLEDDINQNRKIIERNRIKYTAVTRPTDKLFVVKR